MTKTTFICSHCGFSLLSCEGAACLTRLLSAVIHKNENTVGDAYVSVLTLFFLSNLTNGCGVAYPSQPFFCKKKKTSFIVMSYSMLLLKGHKPL